MKSCVIHCYDYLPSRRALALSAHCVYLLVRACVCVCFIHMSRIMQAGLVAAKEEQKEEMVEKQTTASNQAPWKKREGSKTETSMLVETKREEDESSVAVESAKKKASSFHLRPRRDCHNPQ